MDGAKGRK